MFAVKLKAGCPLAPSGCRYTPLRGRLLPEDLETGRGLEFFSLLPYMDKVILQNAANAEESQRASEEMSAQGEKIRGLVERLVALVDGRGKSSELNRSEGTHP